MTPEAVDPTVPEVVVYHREQLEEIAKHTSGYVEVCDNGAAFFATGSCHLGYIQPILNAQRFLWNADDHRDAIDHFCTQCRARLMGIQEAGFTMERQISQTTEWYSVETERYLRYCTRIERSKNGIGNTWKEFWERKKYWMTGKRKVPAELQEAFHAFAREILTLRSCASDEEIFREAMRTVIVS